eukprot:446704_1
MNQIYNNDDANINNINDDDFNQIMAMIKYKAIDANIIHLYYHLYLPCIIITRTPSKTKNTDLASHCDAFTIFRYHDMVDILLRQIWFSKFIYKNITSLNYH